MWGYLRANPAPVLDPEVMEVTDKATVLVEFKGRAENKETALKVGRSHTC